MHSRDLTPALAADIQGLCDKAYREDTSGYFASLGAGDHLVGRVGSRIVSHLMWVTRWLEPQGRDQLRTAYIEMVATNPSDERQGHASALLRTAESMIQDFDVAALCPATEALFERLGWRFWRGPLFARTANGLEATPAEEHYYAMNDRVRMFVRVDEWAGNPSQGVPPKRKVDSLWFAAGQVTRWVDSLG